jgi:hypothetical protein
LFVSGLDNPLHTKVSLQHPATLDDVVIFARVYE